MMKYRTDVQIVPAFHKQETFTCLTCKATFDSVHEFNHHYAKTHTAQKHVDINASPDVGAYWFDTSEDAKSFGSTLDDGEIELHPDLIPELDWLSDEEWTWTPGWYVFVREDWPQSDDEDIFTLYTYAQYIERLQNIADAATSYLNYVKGLDLKVKMSK